MRHLPRSRCQSCALIRPRALHHGTCRHGLQLNRADATFALLLQSIIELVKFFLVGRLEWAMALPKVRWFRLLVLPVLEKCSLRFTSVPIMRQRNELPIDCECLVETLEGEHSLRVVHDNCLHGAPAASEGNQIALLCF
jgi:hypothetical protein